MLWCIGAEPILSAEKVLWGRTECKEGGHLSLVKENAVSMETRYLPIDGCVFYVTRRG